MLTMTVPRIQRSVNAGAAARAWINAFLAASDEESKKVLYRTISIEFFEGGVQFISCSGTLLFRTWVPIEPDPDDDRDWKTPPMPELEEAPDVELVVMDDDKFALSFMKAALAATPDAVDPTMLIAVEEADIIQTSLGSDFSKEVLTLRAFGQQLHCKVYDAPYPSWRHLNLGIDRSERVDGMTISPDVFKTIGQLKGVTSIDLDFKGKTKSIDLHARGICEVRGLAMPMRRPAKDE